MTVVLDPSLMLAVKMFPCEDGHANERSLFGQVLGTVRAKDLYIADRNMCTLAFLFGLEEKEAAFIIRQHQSLPSQDVEQLQPLGRVDGGELFVQTVLLRYEGREFRIRRVLLKLVQPTRDGETEIGLFTNLPIEAASSELVAQLYRERWTLETVFQVITDTIQKRD